MFQLIEFQSNGMLREVWWDRLSAAVTRRRSWLLVVVILTASIALMALADGSNAASQSPVSVPDGSESAKAAAALHEFSGGDRVSAILVITRSDGARLTSADLVAADEARRRMDLVPRAIRIGNSPVVASDDGKAALA